MKTTEVISVGGRQAVVLPEDVRFADRTVSIRRDGAAIVLGPLLPKTWPEGFFDTIRIVDPGFTRPPQ